MTQIKEIDNQIAVKKKELSEVNGTECEVYSRIVGYYRPLNQFNEGQAAQYKIRKLYKFTNDS